MCVTEWAECKFGVLVFPTLITKNGRRAKEAVERLRAWMVDRGHVDSSCSTKDCRTRGGRKIRYTKQRDGSIITSVDPTRSVSDASMSSTSRSDDTKCGSIKSGTTKCFQSGSVSSTKRFVIKRTKF